MSDNPSAFPLAVPGDCVMQPEWGMLRDWFAGQVLPVVAVDIAQDRNHCPPEDLPRLTAVGAYLYADAMLAERAKSSPSTGLNGGEE